MTQAQEVQALADADSAAPLPTATFVTDEGEDGKRGRGAALCRDPSLRPPGRRLDRHDLRPGRDDDDRGARSPATSTSPCWATIPNSDAAFALGQQVVVVLDDTAYRVIAET